VKEFLINSLRKLPSLLGAVLFALLIWFFVAMTKKYTAARSVPVVIKSDGASRTVKNDYPETVEVKMEGEGWKILSLYLGRVEWAIDLNSEVQRAQLDIQTEKNAAQYLKPLPDGVSILEVQPQRFRLELDEKIEKRIPIVLAENVAPVSGYSISGKIKLEPESLTVSGARSIVASLKEWRAYPLKNVPVKNEFELACELDDSLTDIVKLSADKIKAKGFAEQISEAEFHDIPISIIKTKRPLFVTLIPNRITLVLSGAVSDLAKVRAESLSVSVDAEQILSDTTGYVMPQLRLPKGLHLRKQTPQELQYILRN
jgi:YbbR domain-containing protein